MDEMNQIENYNSSNKNTDEIINKIQNSLERLQTAINNRQIIDNINNNQNKNLTLRKKTFETKNIQRKENPSLKEETTSNLLINNNNNHFLLNTDKRIPGRKTNQNRVLNYSTNIANSINRTTENINLKSSTRRNDLDYKNNYNRYNQKLNINKRKCFKCGNINPPRSKFCFNCGNSLNVTTKNSLNNIIIPNEEVNNIKVNKISKSEIITSSDNNNININSKIMNNIYADLNEIQNEDLINYKKLNDLYLYGDYLENELKTSNDENLKLLEKYKTIKTQVHSLNQKKNKIKQNIEILNKKEKELDKINSELKNGFDFVQKKLGNNDNIQEKKNLLNELELNNKKYIDIQNEYDKEIESLKNKISLLADNDEEEDEDDKKIKNLENYIDKEKKDLEEKNMVYLLLIKKNELLNEEINNLAKELDLDLNEENEEENLEEEEEIKEDNNINNKNDNVNNEINKQENNSESTKEKMEKDKDEINEGNNKENKDEIEPKEIKNDIKEDNNNNKNEESNKKKEEKDENKRRKHNMAE